MPILNWYSYDRVTCQRWPVSEKTELESGSLMLEPTTGGSYSTLEIILFSIAWFIDIFYKTSPEKDMPLYLKLYPEKVSCFTK